MTHKLGMHWLRYHQDGRDLEHIERMQYRSIKPFQWMWNNRDFCRDLLTVLPQDAYILARDHPLSEQKEAMWRDPAGTGVRHANEWASKVSSGDYHLPVERTFFLGINEPDATNGDRNAIDIYTASYLDRLGAHGLRGGAFSFSTGHPRTVDGTPHTPADYTIFERSHQAIVKGNHIAVAHIYGTAAVPLAPGNFDRLAACKWTDVEWVIGEFGIDEHVIGGGGHAGFHAGFNGRLHEYCGWIDRAIMGIEAIFPYIHDYELYTYDFSHPWDSFDVRAIREALESYNWQHAKRTPSEPSAQPVTVHLPIIQNGKPTAIVDAPATETPVENGIIEPRVAQAILKIESGGRTHSENGKPIIRFESHIFKAQLGNDALWAQHFRTDAMRPWVDQVWRSHPSVTWQPIHTGKQADEWQVFEFAILLSAAQTATGDSAYKSISIGSAQIMGFNHARIGYPSAYSMFTAFHDAQLQTIGFINFCLSDPALMDAMRRKDWREVAKRYNGAGAVDTYSKLLEQAYGVLGGQ